MPCCNAATYVWATTSHSIYVNFCYLLLVELCFGTLLFLICFFWGFTALNGVVFQVVTSNKQNINNILVLRNAFEKTRKQIYATVQHWQILQSATLEQCHTWTGVCYSAVSACGSQIRWCCDYYQQKCWYHQSAHRQSLGKCSHEIKGVCKCQWCWLAENPRIVCQRTPMDDRTDADAYPWG